MLNIFVKDLGSGYIEGDIITWTATQLNNLDAVSGATTNAVVTVSTFDIKQLPVLKTHVAYWLPQLNDVLAFSSAQSRDGGTGAIYVILKSSKK